jgi:hypothetical protein
MKPASCRNRGRAPTTRETGARRSPPNGAWPFAADPQHDPRVAPALWRPDTAPVVLTLTPALAPSSQPPLSLGHLRPIALHHSAADEQHLVADDAHGRHRLVLHATDGDAQLALALPVDAAMAIRIGAASRLAHATTGPASGYQPTAIQRSRLAMLLRILDAEQAGMPKREIAATLIYPHMSDLHGAAWKASAERRRTHRLRDEAVRLRDAGIADLLHGRLRPTG